MKSFIIYFFIAILGYALADFLNWPSWTVFLLLIIAFVIMLCRMLYVMYGTKNIKKVERFLASNRKEPIYAFVFEQANGSKVDQLNSIENILRKYPKGYIHQNYLFVRELLNENYHSALNEAEKIGKEPYMSYSKALVYATEGNREQALFYQLDKQWMKEAILATLAKAEKNQKVYETHKENAINASRGIQRFGLIHSL
ncbi:hypothetical protein [Ureibacillus manganicus]|uniref:Uncharacterized protein n=1 Tax=Ureibacillus manganicus DSM 26584 TaxID=1384049 RepID=A0A0A3I107_9BACL|nr:hypothetical protein [Ureibacillus manganicus]KGR78394.1 hypothetical protein CD29_11805 [Ureibacillus manganicus DSM 26584]